MDSATARTGCGRFFWGVPCWVALIRFCPGEGFPNLRANAKAMTTFLSPLAPPWAVVFRKPPLTWMPSLWCITPKHAWIPTAHTNKGVNAYHKIRDVRSIACHAHSYEATRLSTSTYMTREFSPSSLLVSNQAHPQFHRGQDLVR